MHIGISNLRPGFVPKKLSTLALVSFSVIQVPLAWGYVHFYTHFFGLTGGASAPYRAMIPSTLYLLTAFATVRLFQIFLRADLWSRSPFYCENNWIATLAAGFLGFLPMVVHLTTGLFFLNARVQWKPLGESFALAPSLAFLVVCCLNAGAEELVFRNTPIALAGKRKAVLAFLVPSLVFVFVHFIAPNQLFGYWRGIELLSAALFFFAIALNQGLLAATLAHTAWNLSLFLTDGSWDVGAVMNIHWASSKESYLFGNCVCLWVITLPYILAWARVKQKRATPPDFTLRLTRVTPA